MASSVDGGSALVKSRLGPVLLALGVSLFLVMGATVAVVELIIMRINPDYNTKRFFEDGFENNGADIYKEIVKDTIPYIQNWYRESGLNHVELLPPAPPKKSHIVGSDPTCLASYRNEIGERSTSPVFVELVLDNLGLRKSRQVRRLLHDHLNEPQSLSEMFNQSFTCLSNVIGLRELACTLRENTSSSNWTEPDRAHYVEYSIHLYAVLEVLTSTLPSDLPALSEVIDIMVNDRFHDIVDFWHQHKDGSAMQFTLNRFHRVFSSLQLLAERMAANKQVELVDNEMALNILEAVKLSAVHGNDETARLGLALATSIPFKGIAQDQKFIWKLGKNWIDAYTTWNMAFILEGSSFIDLIKHLIPSISCASNNNGGEAWILKRTLSQALSFMLVVQPPSSALSIPHEAVVSIVQTRTQMDLTTAIGLGKINLETATITCPSTNSVEKVLHRLCGGQCHAGSWGATDTVPHALMDDHQVRIYIGFVIGATCILTGLGLEAFFFIYLLRSWCPILERYWRLAQFLFPLLVSTAFGMACKQQFLSISVMVVGLYKFGFPETLAYMYLALHDKSGGALRRRLPNFLDAVGIVVHHSAFVLFLSMLLLEVGPVSRYVLLASFVLVMQHWFILLKYVNQTAYIAVELFLEFWFEWIVISQFQYYRWIHWVGAWLSASMLFAHWIFLAAAGSRLLTGEAAEETNVFVAILRLHEKEEKKSRTSSPSNGSSNSDPIPVNFLEDNQE